MSNAIDTQHALIFTMVTMSGVEGHIGDKELRSIGQVVKYLPVFKDFDAEKLTFVAKECGRSSRRPEGLDAVLGLIAEALSPKLRETAYALAVEIAAADLRWTRRNCASSPCCATGSGSTSSSPPPSSAPPSPATRRNSQQRPRGWSAGMRLAKVIAARHEEDDERRPQAVIAEAGSSSHQAAR